MGRCTTRHLEDPVKKTSPVAEKPSTHRLICKEKVDSRGPRPTAILSMV